MEKRKINVLVLNEPENLGGVTWWRMYRPLEHLERNYPEFRIIWNRGVLLPIDFLQADIFLAFRPSNPQQLHVLKIAKQHGKPIILDYDDDLYSIPPYHGDFGYFEPQRGIVRQCIALASEVWVSTDTLGKALGHPNTQVIPNALFPEDMPDAPNPITKTIAFRASHACGYDVQAWEKWHDELLQESEVFHWIGSMQNFKHSEKKTRYTPLLDLHEYFAFMQSIRPNVLWKPLLDIPFNRSKSNIAELEACMFGAICITNFGGTGEWITAVKSLQWDKIADKWHSTKKYIVRHYNLHDWNEHRFNRLLYHTSPENQPVKL